MSRIAIVQIKISATDVDIGIRADKGPRHYCEEGGPLSLKLHQLRKCPPNGCIVDAVLFLKRISVCVEKDLVFFRGNKNRLRLFFLKYVFYVLEIQRWISRWGKGGYK